MRLLLSLSIYINVFTLLLKLGLDKGFLLGVPFGDSWGKVLSDGAEHQHKLITPTPAPASAPFTAPDSPLASQDTPADFALGHGAPVCGARAPGFRLFQTPRSGTLAEFLPSTR